MRRLGGLSLVASAAAALLIPVAVRADMADGPAFVRVIGGEPPMGYLNSPMGAAVSPAEDGRLYVADTGNARIHVFSRSGQPLGVWGDRGVGPGRFWHPTDVAVSADGRYVFVVDEQQGVVQRFEPSPACFEYRSLSCFEGDEVLTWTGDGTEEGKLREPVGVVVLPDGDVAVADADTDLIHVYGPDGSYVRRFGAPGTEVGELNHPTDLAVSADGLLMVADRDNHRIAYFTPKGEVFGVYSGGARFFHPSGLAVDHEGGLLVRDYDPSFGTPRLWRFDAERSLVWERSVGGTEFDHTYPLQGAAVLPNEAIALTDPTAAEVMLKYLERDGSVTNVALRGREPRQFASPEGVAIDPYFIAVTDPDLRRLTVMSHEDRLVALVDAYLTPEVGFQEPRGVAVWRAGDDPNDAVIYVADSGAHQVVALSPGGEVLQRWGAGPGGGDEQFRAPYDVAVTPSGDVLVADTFNDRIVRRAPDGRVLGIIEDEPGELVFPISVTVGPLGYIYVLESRRNRLQAYDLQGNRVLRWETEGDSETTRPGDLWLPVAVDSDGRYVYVLENNGREHVRVQVFTVEKSYPNNVLSIFAQGTGATPGSLWDPSDLAVSLDGRVLIADRGNSRLQLFAWPDAGPIWTPSPTVTPTDPPWPTETPTPQPTRTPLEPGGTEPPGSPTPEPTSTAETPATSTLEPTDRSPGHGLGRLYLPMGLSR